MNLAHRLTSVIVITTTNLARHRERYSITPTKAFTIVLELCSRSAGISVHVVVETVFTMSRNMHLTPQPFQKHVRTTLQGRAREDERRGAKFPENPIRAVVID